jgi:hypothetical protein
MPSGYAWTAGACALILQYWSSLIEHARASCGIARLQPHKQGVSALRPTIAEKKTAGPIA